VKLKKVKKLKKLKKTEKFMMFAHKSIALDDIEGVLRNL